MVTRPPRSDVLGYRGAKYQLLVVARGARAGRICRTGAERGRTPPYAENRAGGMLADAGATTAGRALQATAVRANSRRSARRYSGSCAESRLTLIFIVCSQLYRAPADAQTRRGRADDTRRFIWRRGRRIALAATKG